MKNKILVYVEIFNNEIEDVVKEIISKVKDSFSDIEISGACIISDEINDSIKNELCELGLDNIYFLKNEKFIDFDVVNYANALKSIIDNYVPNILLIGATDYGRELAPRLASKLNIGLTADCTDVSVDENNTFLATRPTYGGKMMAVIASKSSPAFATIRPGAFKLNDYTKNTTKFIDLSQESLCFDTNIEFINKEFKYIKEDLSACEIIFSGGVGLKTKENFDKLKELAQKFDVKIAASRAAVELGWADQSLQVGQTGQSVKPKLYVAFGISGAMQHLVGITNSDKVIAVNTDENAPIMSFADFAIKADAIQLITDWLNN